MADDPARELGIDAMKKKLQQIKEAVVAKAGDVFVSAVRFTMDSRAAAEQVRRVRDKYPALPVDKLADVLLRTAARKTKWEGAANGLAISAGEAAAAVPVPEAAHKIVAGTGVVALLLGDLAYTTKVQVQLLLSIAELYGVPFDPDDEDDVYTVFKAALGLKGTERIGSYARFAFNETVRKQFRAYLRTGVRRVMQRQVNRIAGQKVGRYLGERYLMKLIPVLNAGVGYALNNAITNGVGKWAKVKAKLRSSVFRQIDTIREIHQDSMVWVLPIIFYVGTANNDLSENVLALYSQSANRLGLNELQVERVEALIESADLSRVFESQLPSIGESDIKNALYDLALTRLGSRA